MSVFPFFSTDLPSGLRSSVRSDFRALDLLLPTRFCINNVPLMQASSASSAVELGLSIGLERHRHKSDDDYFTSASRFVR